MSLLTPRAARAGTIAYNALRHAAHASASTMQRSSWESSWSPTRCKTVHCEADQCGSNGQHQRSKGSCKVLVHGRGQGLFDAEQQWRANSRRAQLAIKRSFWCWKGRSAYRRSIQAMAESAGQHTKQVRQALKGVARAHLHSGGVFEVCRPAHLQQQVFLQKRR